MKISKTIPTLLAAAGLAVSAWGAQVPSKNPKLDQDVRKAVNTVPYYGVFDNIGYSIADDGTVTVSGQVTQYYTHNSAISAVKRVEGVTRVVDQLEVLPLSPYDDNLRIRAYNAIFGYPALSRYAINARPPIRIIVKRGNISIEGVVNNELDRNLVYNRVQNIAGAFSVTNDLRLDP
jgi:hyperosmotically inducible periplasmic protein